MRWESPGRIARPSRDRAGKFGVERGLAELGQALLGGLARSRRDSQGPAPSHAAAL
jgi:hypothetical protein